LDRYLFALQREKKEENAPVPVPAHDAWELWGAMLIKKELKMSSTVLSQSASAYDQGLAHMAEQLKRAGAPPLTIALTIARLKGGKKRRRIASRIHRQFGLVLGEHSADAILADPSRN
jgi:hypothetical protein